MSEAVIHIQPTVDEKEMCARVRAHLKTSWEDPGRIEVGSRAVIRQHLAHCESCRKELEAIVATTLPPWQKESQGSDERA